MSTLMLNARIKPCKERSGIVFINDEEGVNDLEETPEALDIRADIDSASYIDKYLAWGEDDAQFFSVRKPALSSKISVAGSHRSDLLNDIGRFLYKPDVSSIQTLFGDYVLFNDNLAVDHFDQTYKPPTNLFNADSLQHKKAASEWTSVVEDHRSRRVLVRDFILDLAENGLNIIVRPHPVYDSLFWHNSFRLIPNIQTIYQGPVEPWIHASRAVLTTGCTTGLQALIAGKPSFELPIGNSKAFSTSILPVCNSASDLIPSNIKSKLQDFAISHSTLQSRWKHDGSSTENFSNSILDSLSTLQSHSSIDWIKSIKPLKTSAPKWRNLTPNQVQARFQRICKLLAPEQNIKCQKVTNALYTVFCP